MIPEFGSNFSTILDKGHPLLPKDPLDADSDWVCDKTGTSFYYVFHILPQIYTATHVTFPIQMYAITE